MEIEKQRDNLVADPQKALLLLLVAVSGLFSDLEASIAHLHATSQVIKITFKGLIYLVASLY